MLLDKDIVLYDKLNNIVIKEDFSGSIISILDSRPNKIIFSDNISIKDDNVSFKDAMITGFNLNGQKMTAFSKKIKSKIFNLNDFEYIIRISDDIMTQYDEGQFSEAFPFTINLLHTAGLYLNHHPYIINHLDFFKGEILKNPVAAILNGICIADRVVIDERGNPVFYDCLIIGRGKNEELSVSYEPLVNVQDKVLEYVIILGIEELSESIK
ncbi:MAG: hypothetical protein ACFFBP_08045 [Promethearchaeota archaeon]